MIEIVTGDIFDAKEKYLLHQCNCITNKAAHLSKDVFNKYPWADIYARRYAEGIKDTPGQIMIRGNGTDQRYVINCLGQYYPGKPKYPTSALDGTKVREKYFHECLLRVAKIPDLESVAIPWRIGCGAAGGDWDHYLGTITNFAQYVKATHNAKVIIYQREGDE
jgi:O-acetyl-ADP-ribose deacetylase (regulator of RNase III)